MTKLIVTQNLISDVSLLNEELKLNINIEKITFEEFQKEKNISLFKSNDYKYIFDKFVTYSQLNKEKYDFLKWDCELGDCVMFNIRTLHGTLNQSEPKRTLSRYTLRLAKEDVRINYVGDWTSFNYRKAMQDAGYKNGDKLGGSMFPQLWPHK